MTLQSLLVVGLLGCHTEGYRQRRHAKAVNATIDHSGPEDTFDIGDDRADEQTSLDRLTGPQGVMSVKMPGDPVCASPGPGRRVVSVADWHGDFIGLLDHLKQLGLVNRNAGRSGNSWDQLWVGGNTVFVQTGDILDRGPDGKMMYKFLWALQDSAAASGGEVVLLTGNHELMVLQGDIRYVTDIDFCSYTADNCGGKPPKKASYCRDCCNYVNDGCNTGMDCLEGNCEFLAAWGEDGEMGGEMRRRFKEGKMKVAYKIGGIVFTHAGLVSSLWSKVASSPGDDPIEKLNAQATKLFSESSGHDLRYSSDVVAAGGSQGGPMWTRVCYNSWYTAMGRRRRNGHNKPYYMDADEFERVEPGRCETIAASLKEISASRMVIGHCAQDAGTVQTSCNGTFLLSDTYMSIAYAGSRGASNYNQAALEFFSEDSSQRVWAVYSGRDACDRLPDI